MNAPRRRRRVGGLALAIPLVALSPVAGRAEDPAIPELVPVSASAESIPDLPGIPTETATTPDRAGETIVDAVGGAAPAAAPPAETSPPAPAPDETPPPVVSLPPAAGAQPLPPAEAPDRGDPVERVFPPAAASATVPADVEGAAGDPSLIPTAGLRPLGGLPSPQATDPGAAYPSAQGGAPSWLTRNRGLRPAEPTVLYGPNQARTGAGHVADGAGKIVCGFGRMLRGTGQIIGSGFHALGNATENLFGAGDHLMNRGGHRLFDAAHEVAPDLSTPAAPVPVASEQNLPPSSPPPRIVPSGPYPAPQG